MDNNNKTKKVKKSDVKNKKGNKVKIGRASCRERV